MRRRAARARRGGCRGPRCDRGCGRAAHLELVVLDVDDERRLVAGGLGERLGYDGIKVELPTETLTCASFLETYITALLAMQRRAGADPSRCVPLIIMTSEDTHEKTLALLEAHDYFGMPREQLHFIRQSNVPALCDNGGRFAQAKADAFCLQTKPHGHGDVHTLLHTSGLLPQFLNEGRTHVVFFQV